MIKLKSDNSKITRSLGKKHKLIPYLEKAIISFDDEWQFIYKEKQSDHHWHPSTHCTLPPSRLYEIAVNPLNSSFAHSASLKKAFQVGHFWHQWLQYIIEHKLEFATSDDVERHAMRSWGNKEVAKVGVNSHGLTAKDWKPAPYHSVAGSADISPCKAPGWTGGVDIKTMNSRDFGQSGVPDWCAAKYECQFAIYMDLFDQDQWLMLGVCKDSPHEFKEILYNRNQPLINAIYERFQFVSDAIDEGFQITTLDDDQWKELPLTGPSEF